MDHQQRLAGVLLHISSLPSADMGEDAYAFIDFLAESKVAVWQTLPINMPHQDNSPYQCLSAHAGNPVFISLPKLKQIGLIKKLDLSVPKSHLIEEAYDTYISDFSIDEYVSFCQLHATWINDFALFLVIREQQQLKGWHEWPEPFKSRHSATIEAFVIANHKAIDLVKFTQFLFFKQWLELKNYANLKGVQLFGDIPIFVAYDSADVWAQPNLFKLDAEKRMTVVAGVPPDYFSETGQRWGNPHYDWTAMADTGFAWWLARIRTQAALFDFVRIDHFRGLESAWEIPADEETAINGTWVQAPGSALLNTIQTNFPQMRLIAEDLGIITEEVDALRQAYHLPGMKVLHFAFGGDETNPYLPENIDYNSVVYTGTHDNDTTLGWYQLCEPHVKAHLHRYLKNEAPQMPQALMELAFSTTAFLAIVPMQDVLGLDSNSRMNTPGTIDGNWRWQFNWAQLTPSLQSQFKQMIDLSNRYG